MATKFAPNTVEELKELLKNDIKVKVAGASPRPYPTPKSLSIDSRC